MYAILISIVLALYASVLVDFSLLYQEMAASASVLDSAQAFYSAESAAEKAWHETSDPFAPGSNIVFAKEGQREDQKQQEDFLFYNEETGSHYLNRQMFFDSESLESSDATRADQQMVKGGVYLVKDETLDPLSIYGLDAIWQDRFAIREVEPESNFNEIVFEYNQESETSEIAFEVFAFPTEGETVSLPRFEELESGEQGSIRRVVINTKDPSQSGQSFDAGGHMLSVNFSGAAEHYKHSLSVSGFQPLAWNYILSFQTLDQQPIHYRLAAFHQGKPMILPNAMQTVDVIGATASGTYQRIKMQKRSEANLFPELNFAVLSQENIHK